MNARRTTVGLSLLCALAFCAFAAQSASAQKGTPSVNTTAFTCSVGGDLDFAEKDTHCDNQVEPGTGEYGHTDIEANKTTEIEVTNEQTANKTTEAASITLKYTYLKIAVEITCKTASNVEKKSFIHNVESEGKHTVTGTMAVALSGCQVNKPAGCIASEPIELKAQFVGVEGLGTGKNTHGVEFKDDPSSIGSITLTDKPGAECVLAKKAATLDGTAIATGTPNPGAEFSGSTWKFEPGNEMQTLTVEGKTAELTATLTPRMAVKEYPIPFTTVT